LGIDCVVFLELLYKRKINREINVLYDVKNREKGFPLMKAFIHSIYEFSHQKKTKFTQDRKETNEFSKGEKEGGKKYWHTHETVNSFQSIIATNGIIIGFFSISYTQQK